MGLGPRLGPSPSSYDENIEAAVSGPTRTSFSNPDPTNYTIVKSERVGAWLVIKVNYPDCTNFEGNKILVYPNLTVTELVNQGSIDPHFSNCKTKFSPFARFKPTEEGWRSAVEFVKKTNIK